MPRPKSKDELLQLSAENFDKLLKISNEQSKLLFPDKYMNRNAADVLAHIYHWHLMMKEWYKTGMSGEKPEMPAPGYTWKTVPDLNQWINKKYSGLTYDEVVGMVKNTHESIVNLIKSHSNEELFEKKRYKWTGTTSLGAYLISATSSHYDWGIKLIKKAAREE